MLMVFHNIAHNACCEMGVIHRDISFNNILLVPNKDHEQKGAYTRRGMLIDFDYAASMKQQSKIGHRTVRSPSS